MKKRKNVVSIKLSGKDCLRRAAVTGAAFLMISASGCTDVPENYYKPEDPNVEQLVPTEIVETTLEEKWETAKNEAKQQLNTWYKENIMDSKTMQRFFKREYSEDKSSCLPIKTENNLPKYYTLDSVEKIPQLIGECQQMLDLYDVSYIKTEDDIKNVISKICGDYGFYIGVDGKFYFENEYFPKFADQTQTQPVIYAITTGDLAYFIVDENIFADAKNNSDVYNWTVRYDADNVIEYEEKIDGMTLKAMNDCYPNSVRNLIFIVGDFNELELANMGGKGITFEKNGQELHMHTIYVQDIFKNVAFMFEGDEEFKKMCEAQSQILCK